MDRPAIAALLVALLCVTVLAEDPPASPESKSDSSEAKQWIAARSKQLANYGFQLEGAAKPLEFESRCLLSWSNPERAAAHGGVFGWTYQGRLQLLVCAYTMKDGVKHEFQSLAEQEITTKLGDREMHRFAAGPEWKELPGSPSPHEKQSLRLSQFRRQAQRFAVRFGGKNQWSEARLLTQPVFVSPDGNSMLFLFVQGTDPECSLHLEVTEDKKWRYALARQTKWALRVQLDDQQIWERIPNRKDDQADTSFVVLDERAE